MYQKIISKEAIQHVLNPQKNADSSVKKEFTKPKSLCLKTDGKIQEGCWIINWISQFTRFRRCQKEREREPSRNIKGEVNQMFDFRCRVSSKVNERYL